MNALMVIGILAGAVLLGWLVCFVGSIRCVVTVESTCAHCDEKHSSQGTLFGALKEQVAWENKHWAEHGIPPLSSWQRVKAWWRK